MSKLIVAIVASAFAFGSAAGFAAETAKKEELTKEQRAEMRSRAESLTTARAQGQPEHHILSEQAPKAKKHHGTKKSKKKTTPDVKPAQPKA